MFRRNVCTYGRIFLRAAGFEKEDGLEECIKNVVIVPEDLVRFVAQFEVEPTELPVISTNDEMLARRVHVHRRNPAYAWRERFEERLLRQVVHPHITLSL